MNKKIIISITTFLVSTGSIFAIPNDPNNFYGDITVNNKIIDDSTLNYYLDNTLIGSKPITDSKYGQGFKQIVITGQNGQTIDFELVSNSCASSTDKISIEYVEGKTINLDLDFTGTNTCNDEPVTETPTNPTSGGSSGGGGGSSSGGGSVSPVEPTQINTTDEPTLEVKETLTEESARTKAFLADDKQRETVSKIDNISIVNSQNAGIERIVESSLESNSPNGLSGNIVANTSKSLIGIIILILTITGFILWRENKKRKLRLKKESKVNQNNNSTTENLTVNVENDLDSKKE